MLALKRPTTIDARNPSIVATGPYEVSRHQLVYEGLQTVVTRLRVGLVQLQVAGIGSPRPSAGTYAHRVFRTKSVGTIFCDSQ